MNLEELKEIQTNEIEALKAIFMEDYQEVVNKTAWKVYWLLFFFKKKNSDSIQRLLTQILNSYYTCVP